MRRSERGYIREKIDESADSLEKVLQKRIFKVFICFIRSIRRFSTQRVENLSYCHIAKIGASGMIFPEAPAIFMTLKHKE